MRILHCNPDNGVTCNFMLRLWMFLLQALTPPGYEVLLIDGNAQPPGLRTTSNGVCWGLAKCDEAKNFSRMSTAVFRPGLLRILL